MMILVDKKDNNEIKLKKMQMKCLYLVECNILLVNRIKYLEEELVFKKQLNRKLIEQAEGSYEKSRISSLMNRISLLQQKLRKNQQNCQYLQCRLLLNSQIIYQKDLEYTEFIHLHEERVRELHYSIQKKENQLMFFEKKNYIQPRSQFSLRSANRLFQALEAKLNIKSAIQFLTAQNNLLKNQMLKDQIYQRDTMQPSSNARSSIPSSRNLIEDYSFQQKQLSKTINIRLDLFIKMYVMTSKHIDQAIYSRDQLQNERQQKIILKKALNINQQLIKKQQEQIKKLQIIVKKLIKNTKQSYSFTAEDQPHVFPSMNDSEKKQYLLKQYHSLTVKVNQFLKTNHSNQQVRHKLAKYLSIPYSQRQLYSEQFLLQISDFGNSLCQSQIEIINKSLFVFQECFQFSSTQNN